MTARSITRRTWWSFLGERATPHAGTSGRGRDGYTLGRRFWASFIGVNLPVDHTEPVRSPTGLPVARERQSGSEPLGPDSGWFPLPRLLRVDGLTATGDDAIVMEASSPDTRTRFLLRTDGAEEPEFRLEVVYPHIDEGLLVVCAVRYTSADGDKRVILVPVSRGDFGPPASLVRLPGFALDSATGWSARVPVPLPASSLWDAVTVVASVRAALNEATREAWRKVKEFVDDELSIIIGGELA